jgi:hypothetical protein
MVQLNSATPVTLTTPTTATLITGLTAQITIPPMAKVIKVSVQGSSATVTAAATITTALYFGATTGLLTTQVAQSVVVAPTGGTSVAVNSIFYVPVTAASTTFPGSGSTAFLSIAATASSGNYVLNTNATLPTTMTIEAY